MASRFAAVTNKEISQIIKQALLEIHEEGDKSRFGSLNRWSFAYETGEKVFCLQMQIKLSLRLLYLAELFINKLKSKFNSFFFVQNGFKYNDNSQLL